MICIRDFAYNRSRNYGLRSAFIVNEPATDSRCICVRSVNEADILVHRHICECPSIDKPYGCLPIRGAHLVS